MAKVIFEYDQHEDSELIDMVRNAPKMHSTLWDFDQDVLRNIIKYEDLRRINLDSNDTDTEEKRAFVIRVVDAIRTEFRNIVSSHGIEL